MTQVPLDTVGFESWFLAQEGELFWPTPPEAHRNLAAGVLQLVVAAFEEVKGLGELERAFTVKMHNVCHDLTRLGCLSLDVGNVEARGHSGAADQIHNPLANYLMTGTGPAECAFRNDWPQRASRFGSAKAQMKRVIRYSQGAYWHPSRRFDVISANELSTDFVERSGMPARRLFSYLEACLPPRGAQEPIKGIADWIVSRFVAALKSASVTDTIAARAQESAKAVAVCHLSQAWRDALRLKGSSVYSNLADVVVSGTPKYLGRLISSIHREEGGSVYRFAHGGERVFFEDPDLPLNEFIHCDRYYCFSKGEAINTTARIKERRVAWVSSDIPDFVGLGSPRHEILHNRGLASRRTRSEKKVLYMPNKYIGEALYLNPRFRVNDALYLEWQIWLIRTLRARGYTVVGKAHPAESHHHLSVLKQLCDGVVTGNIDLANSDHDCVLFDFAGTAFFDSLASNCGVVLIDNGMRPIDPVVKADLENRVVLVGATPNQCNLFRANADELTEAIEGARKKSCSAEFFDLYFGSDP